MLHTFSIKQQESPGLHLESQTPLSSQLVALELVLVYKHQLLAAHSLDLCG